MDGPWQSEVLADDGRANFFRAAVDSRAQAERNARGVNRLGFVVGATGALVGVVGICAGLVAYIKTPVAEPPQYIGIVDAESGTVQHPTSLKDAPRLFGESVRRRFLAQFVTNCEGYVPQTWAKLDYHACMVMATPDEQKRRERDIGRGGTRYPPTVFGPAGWARPSGFLAFVLLGSTGTEPNRTWHYQVRYERIEVIDGRETRPRYTADVVFTFRPDLKMTDGDRTINEAGFQAVSFSTVRD